MKQDEIFEQESEYLFRIDDEERQTELSGDKSFVDSSTSSLLSRNNSHSDQWLRSSRKSMDMLTGITPPTTTILDSFLDKKQPSSVLDSFPSSASKKPLLDLDNEVDNSAVVSTLSSLEPHLKLSVPDLSFQDENRSCSISQSVFNGINILCGAGLLTLPYAVKEGGWLGLLVLFFFGVITCYTGILLQRCLESSRGLYTYLDIGQAAFGISGRVFVSILLCLELYGGCVEYIITMSDNLSVLFPITSLNIAGISLDSTEIFAIGTTLIVLPTVWLRDLSLLSYLSAGGVVSSILLAFCLFWLGSIDGIGFRITGQALDLTNLPVAVGIFGFGLAGHSVFPNIYSSMKEPSQFPLVLFTSFGFCTLFYIGIGVCGYTIFGDAIQSQFTLNMPQHFTTSKIAVWTAVVTPMLKYALTITPVVLSLEELLPSSKSMRFKGVSLLLRTIVVLSTLVVALAFPFFATVAALVGSFVAMLIAFIFPCLCYLRILKGRLKNTDVRYDAPFLVSILVYSLGEILIIKPNIEIFQIGVCIFIIIIGVVSGCCGTYSAIARLIGEMT